MKIQIIKYQHESENKSPSNNLALNIEFDGDYFVKITAYNHIISSGEVDKIHDEDNEKEIIKGIQEIFKQARKDLK